jgi:hypothetical protein
MSSNEIGCAAGGNAPEAPKSRAPSAKRTPRSAKDGAPPRHEDREARA